MIASHVAEDGAELLPFLFAAYPEVKRIKLRQWLKRGAVHVNGTPALRSKHPLQPGDVVSIEPDREAPPGGLLPAGMTIVFEDDALIVVEKPSNLLSMASPTVRDKTAYAYLTQYLRGGNPRSKKRLWVVHRLDRETSGLLVFAKSESAKRVLHEHWHQVDKRYLAVVEGRMPEQEGVLDSHLDENGPYKVFSAPESERTRHAVTRYEVLQQTANYSLVELQLETGRRNQIRVQLADVNCPIVGDLKYEASTNPAGRLALHASRLELAHPVTGQMLRHRSELPDELARLF